MSESLNAMIFSIQIHTTKPDLVGNAYSPETSDSSASQFDHEKKQETDIYRALLSKLSTLLGQTYTTIGSDHPQKEGVLHEWISTVELADAELDQTINTEGVQQIKIQAWKAFCMRASDQPSSSNLEKSLEAAIKLVKILPAGTPLWIECSLDAGKKLGTIYTNRKTFNGLEGPSLVLTAIDYIQSALSALPDSDRHCNDHQLILETLLLKLINESTTFQTHFWETEDFKFLETSVSLADKAYDGLSLSNSRYARYISNYHAGLMRNDLYTHLGRFSDLQRALQHTESALLDWEEGLSPESDVAKAARTAWRVAYHDQGHLDQLEQSLFMLLERDAPYNDEEVKAGLSMNVGSTHAFYLNLLSEISRISYHRRCGFEPTDQGIDSAVEFSQRSCNHLGPLDPGRYEGFVELTTALMTRFRSTVTQPSDLDRAIQAATVATGLAYKPIYTNPHNTPRRCQRYICKTLDVAADVLTARFLRDRDPRDLDEATHAAFCVANSTHSLHPSRPYQVYSKYERCRLKLILAEQKNRDYSRLSNLISRRAYLDRRSIIARDDPPSVSALSDASKQVKLPLPQGSICRRPALAIVLGSDPVYLDDLSSVAKRGSFPLDLRFSFDSPQYLLDDRPCHSTKPVIEARTYRPVQQISCDSEPDMNHQPSDPDLKDPFKQLKALRVTIRENIAQKNHVLAISSGRLAVNIMRNLDLFLPKEGPKTSQIALVSTLSIEIASEMLKQECDVWDCIRALEAGKELGSRTAPRMLNSYWYKTVRLIREADEINARLRYTTTEWQNRTSSKQSFRETFKQSSSVFFKAITDLYEAEKAIPNYKKFQAECLEQAERGTIIYLVPTEAASFAIILPASDEARILRLQEAPVHQLRIRLTETFNALKECEETGFKGKANPKLRKLLEWLWQAVVRPIIKHLKLQPQDSSEASMSLPIIRWIPFNEFAQAPLQAAGLFKQAESLSQYAISSYLPSIRHAVTNSRRYASNSATADNNLLTVSMPETVATPEGKLADLDVEREHSRITESLRGRFDMNRLISPEMGTLKSLLSNVRLAHFTCHGLLHDRDPLLARLVIWRENLQPLTVGSIQKMAIPGARLAFVSACHSAISQAALQDGAGPSEDIEPGMHVVRALQLAGFPTVVGTLWHAYQESAIDISGHFYQFVADGWEKGKKLDGDLFARALHYALYQYQKEDNRWNAIDWASWVCFSD